MKMPWALKKIEKLPLPAITPSTVSAGRPSGTSQILTPTGFASTIVNNPGTVVWQAGNVEAQVKDGYCANDIVYSIIRLIVNKIKLAPWKEYEIRDEKAYTLLNATLKSKRFDLDLSKLEALHEKALQPARQTTRMSDLILTPNKVDSWGDLTEAYNTFKLITGNTYIYGKMIPTGRDQGTPQSLYTMPSQYMSILTNLNEFPFEPTGYQLYMQYFQSFDLKEIMHDKYFNPNWNIAGMQLYGFSPLQAAAKLLTRSNEGKRAAVATYANGGPKGMLFINDDRYDPLQAVQEAIDIKKQLGRNQGSLNVNQVETSGYKLGFVPLGLSPVDMDLLNAEQMDLRAFCNVYDGVPSQLLNDPVAKTYNSIPEAEKALTVRCALPRLCEQADQFNKKFKSDWKGLRENKNNVIAFDPVVYQELQVSRKQQIDWLKDSLLPVERWHQVLGETTPEWMTEQERRTVFVPSGLNMTLGEVSDPARITPPDGLNDYDKP